MAQVLKDEQRKRIVEAAKNEFLKNGIANSSMRAISKIAQTPVGNIYRYYKNKQELVCEVLSPVLTKLNVFDHNLLCDITLLSESTIRKYLTDFVDNLVMLQNDFPSEMTIIVSDEQINGAYQNELIKLISSIISLSKQSSIDEDEGAQFFSKMIAKSIFAGIREGVSLKCSSNISNVQFKKLMYIYMEKIFLMLEHIEEEI